MQITLSPELEKFARAQVAQGRFKSLSAVVSAALENARRQNSKKPGVNKKSNVQIQEGIDAVERGDQKTQTATVRKKLHRQIQAEAIKRHERTLNGPGGVIAKPNDKLQALLEEGLLDLREGRFTIYDAEGLDTLAERVIREGRARLKKRAAKK